MYLNYFSIKLGKNKSSSKKREGFLLIKAVVPQDTLFYETFIKLIKIFTIHVPLFLLAIHMNQKSI